MKEFNTWKQKKGNTFVSLKIKDMATLHLCKALTLDIKTYDSLLKEHNYLINRKKLVETQMEEVALTGINMKVELENRNINFKFNMKSVSEETLDCFFEQEEIQKKLNKLPNPPKQILIKESSKPILQ